MIPCCAAAVRAPRQATTAENSSEDPDKKKYDEVCHLTITGHDVLIRRSRDVTSPAKKGIMTHLPRSCVTSCVTPVQCTGIKSGSPQSHTLLRTISHARRSSIPKCNVSREIKLNTSNYTTSVLFYNSSVYTFPIVLALVVCERFVLLFHWPWVAEVINAKRYLSLFPNYTHGL